MGRAVGSGEGGGGGGGGEERSLGAVTVYSSSLCAVLASPRLARSLGRAGRREREGVTTFRRPKQSSTTSSAASPMLSSSSSSSSAISAVLPTYIQGASAALQRLPCIFGLSSIEPPGDALMAARRVVIYMTNTSPCLERYSSVCPVVEMKIGKSPREPDRGRGEQPLIAARNV